MMKLWWNRYTWPLCLVCTSCFSHHEKSKNSLWVKNNWGWRWVVHPLLSCSVLDWEDRLQSATADWPWWKISQSLMAQQRGGFYDISSFSLLCSSVRYIHRSESDQNSTLRLPASLDPLVSESCCCSTWLLLHIDFDNVSAYRYMWFDYANAILLWNFS